MSMNKMAVYESVLRDSVAPDGDIDETLWRAWVLHTHSLALRRDLQLDDVRPDADGQGLVLAPLTRNHLAELLASLWPPNDKRGQNAFWFWEAHRVTPYEAFSDLPDEMRDRAAAARRAIAAHALVEELIEE
jgi:hypothetical protein